MTDVPVKPSEPSQDLLEVSKLEHVEAMKRSFRQLSRLGTEEVRRLYNMENINRVRSAIFQLRQIQANRRSDVLRWQALKRRQTSMGNAHVRAFPSGLGFGYTCYFCSVGFKSVAGLHAHLLTQEHLCIRLAPGTKLVVDQKRTSIVAAEEQTNNSNATELEGEDQETHKKDDGSSFPSRSLRRASKIKGKRKGSQVKMMLSVYRCMYCGTYLYKNSIHDHRCLREMYEFLEREMQYMNINGSPFVCLLCQGSVYGTPAQLQLHLAASHGADKGVTHCALCEVKFSPPVMATGDEALRTMATIYQRHLVTEHLPSLELTGKLLYMNPHLIASDIVSSAPADDIAYRSYRCIFQQEQPAGQGAPFPYPHWTNENDRDVWSTSGRQIDTGRFPSGRMGSITPDSGFFKESRRPSKMRCDRTCLISPQLIFEHLVSRFPKFSSSLSQSRPKACPAGRHGNIRNLPYIITHVICEHAGNPFTMSGARELILAQHAITMTNRNLRTIHDVVRLTEAWIGALEGVKGEDDLKTMLIKTPVQSRQSGRLSQLAVPDSKGSSEGRITNKNRNAVSAPQARTRCQSTGTFCQLEKPSSGRLTGIPRCASTISERLLWGSMSGGRLRNQSRSHRISRSPTLARFARNASTIPEEVQQGLNFAAQAQRISCRACKNCVMSSSQALLAHVREDHLRILEARMIQMQRSGAFSGLIDPTRTCFECYTILEDHFAFQLHTIICHGSRYPLVCGLCRQPLVNLCMSKDVHPVCVRMFQECGIKMTEEKWSKILYPLSGTESPASAKPVQNTRKSVHVSDTPTDDELRTTFEMEELVSIVSCTKASLSVLRHSPQLVLKAMQMHEHGHVSELRRRYLLTTEVPNSEKEQAIVGMQQRAMIQGVNQTLVDEYKSLQVRTLEEHERQIQLATIRFGVDVWDQLKYSTGMGPLSKSETKDTSSKRAETELTEELRTKLKDIAMKSSAYD